MEAALRRQLAAAAASELAAQRELAALRPKLREAEERLRGERREKAALRAQVRRAEEDAEERAQGELRLQGELSRRDDTLARRATEIAELRGLLRGAHGDCRVALAGAADSRDRLEAERDAALAAAAARGAEADRLRRSRDELRRRLEALQQQAALAAAAAAATRDGGGIAELRTELSRLREDVAEQLQLLNAASPTTASGRTPRGLPPAPLADRPPEVDVCDKELARLREQGQDENHAAAEATRHRRAAEDAREGLQRVVAALCGSPSAPVATALQAVATLRNEAGTQARIAAEAIEQRDALVSELDALSHERDALLSQQDAAAEAVTELEAALAVQQRLQFRAAEADARELHARTLQHWLASRLEAQTRRATMWRVLHRLRLWAEVGRRAAKQWRLCRVVLRGRTAAVLHSGVQRRWALGLLGRWMRWAALRRLHKACTEAPEESSAAQAAAAAAEAAYAVSAAVLRGGEGWHEASRHWRGLTATAAAAAAVRRVDELRAAFADMQLRAEGGGARRAPPAAAVSLLAGAASRQLRLRAWQRLQDHALRERLRCCEGRLAQAGAAQRQLRAQMEAVAAERDAALAAAARGAAGEAAPPADGGAVAMPLRPPAAPPRLRPPPAPPTAPPAAQAAAEAPASPASPGTHLRGARPPPGPVVAGEEVEAASETGSAAADHDDELAELRRAVAELRSAVESSESRALGAAERADLQLRLAEALGGLAAARRRNLQLERLSCPCADAATGDAAAAAAAAARYRAEVVALQVAAEEGDAERSRLRELLRSAHSTPINPPPHLCSESCRQRCCIEEVLSERDALRERCGRLAEELAAAREGRERALEGKYDCVVAQRQADAAREAAQRAEDESRGLRSEICDLVEERSRVAAVVERLREDALSAERWEQRLAAPAARRGAEAVAAFESAAAAVADAYGAASAGALPQALRLGPVVACCPAGERPVPLDAPLAVLHASGPWGEWRRCVGLAVAEGCDTPCSDAVRVPSALAPGPLRVSVWDLGALVGAAELRLPVADSARVPLSGGAGAAADTQLVVTLELRAAAPLVLLPSRRGEGTTAGGSGAAAAGTAPSAPSAAPAQDGSPKRRFAAYPQG
eukprot:TRINITY_DN10886_c1_g1_i1.p1 TRINITY_DN10886_c1_g1~~TRINITY_DN10886_c1_g1_i1.p1  ORF type:complete len:1224 (+),score=333.27 TRINITY_DN10886_c1_g1_i1:353-3673(+)